MKNTAKKIIQYLKEKDDINYIIIFIVALLVSIPILKISLLETGDDTKIHLLRVLGLTQSIEHSVFPFIVTPFYCNDFGYATNLFYPQLVTYVPYILKIFTPTYESAIDLFTSLTILLSGITMYNFIKQMTKNRIIALMSSILYITFPYRFECIYERFAIGEFTAFIFLPMVFQGLDSLINHDKSKHYLITIGAAGMLLSHSLTTMYTAIFCLIYVLFNIKKFWNKDVIVKCFINLIFILVITALFTVPLLEHKFAAKYAIFNADIMVGTGEYAYDNSATLKKLLTDSGSDKTVSFIIGFPTIIFALFGIYSYRKLQPEDKKWYWQFGLLSIISVFMVSRLFPWKVMPNFLTMIQFTWRILTFTSLFVAPICAINIYMICKNIKNKNNRILFCVFCIIVLVSLSICRLGGFIKEKGSEEHPELEGYEQYMINNPVISPGQINREYLPEKALTLQRTYLLTRTNTVYVLSGNATISQEEKQELNMQFNFNDYEKDTILELPYIYYLGYRIEVKTNDDNTQRIKYVESENGFVSFSLPEDIESAHVTVEYTGTVLEKSAYVVSAIGFISIIVYIILYKKSEKTKGA